MALSQEEERLINDCIDAYSRTIERIKKQIVQLENMKANEIQTSLFDTELNIPVRTK